MSKKILNYNKRRKKFSEFDFFEYVSIEIYLNLLSGFESFKYLFLDKINKDNFEKISDLFLLSTNCKILNPLEETINEKMIEKINSDLLQKEIFKRFHVILENV